PDLPRARPRPAPRPALPPHAGPPRPERPERARLRGGRRALLHVLPLPGGRGLPVGGRGRAPRSPVAPPLAPRRRRGPHLGAEGRAAGPQVGLLRQAAPRPAAPGGPGSLPRLLRARARPAAGAR